MNKIKNNWAFSILIFVFVAVMGFSNIGVEKARAGAPADPPKNDSCKCAVYTEDTSDGCWANDGNASCINREEIEDWNIHKGAGYQKLDSMTNYTNRAWKLKRTFSAWRLNCIKPGPEWKKLEDKAKAEAKKKHPDKVKELEADLEKLRKEGKAHCDKWSGVCKSCTKKNTPEGGEDPFPIIIFMWPFHRLSDAVGS